MKQVASDVSNYWQICEGRKYWNVWAGNPFCSGLNKIPKTCPIDILIEDCKASAKSEKSRFAEQFPDVKWGR